MYETEVCAIAATLPCSVHGQGTRGSARVYLWVLSVHNCTLAHQNASLSGGREEFAAVAYRQACAHSRSSTNHAWNCSRAQCTRHREERVGSQGPLKNSGSHIDASHSRQPLVKGERLVRYEVNAVMHFLFGIQQIRFSFSLLCNVLCWHRRLLNPSLPRSFELSSTVHLSPQLAGARELPAS